LTHASVYGPPRPPDNHAIEFAAPSVEFIHARRETAAPRRDSENARADRCGPAPAPAIRPCAPQCITGPSNGDRETGDIADRIFRIIEERYRTEAKRKGFLT
jgi:hypothetical protein